MQQQSLAWFIKKCYTNGNARCAACWIVWSSTSHIFLPQTTKLSMWLNLLTTPKKKHPYFRQIQEKDKTENSGWGTWPKATNNHAAEQRIFIFKIKSKILQYFLHKRNKNLGLSFQIMQPVQQLRQDVDRGDSSSHSKFKKTNQIKLTNRNMNPLNMSKTDWQVSEGAPPC
jgi:hypothetical protein